VVLPYADEFRAAEVLATLHRLHVGSDLSVADAVCCVRATDWTVSLQQSVDLSARQTSSTGFWPEFVASLVPTPGAFARSPVAETFGLTEHFKRALGAELPPGSSAVLLLVPPSSLERHIAELHRFGGKLLHTAVSGRCEALGSGRPS